MFALETILRAGTTTWVVILTAAVVIALREVFIRIFSKSDRRR